MGVTCDRSATATRRHVRRRLSGDTTNRALADLHFDTPAGNVREGELEATAVRRRQHRPLFAFDR